MPGLEAKNAGRRVWEGAKNRVSELRLCVLREAVFAVEQRRHPELKGKPTAVVMYNPWKGGGIIAVGYEARAAGVTRWVLSSFLFERHLSSRNAWPLVCAVSNPVAEGIDDAVVV